MVYVPAADTKPPESMDLNIGTIAIKDDQEKLAARVAKTYEGVTKPLEQTTIYNDYFTRPRINKITVGDDGCPQKPKVTKVDIPWKSLPEKSSDGSSTDLIKPKAMSRIFDFGSWVNDLVNMIKGNTK